jgi:hypothetical protein
MWVPLMLLSASLSCGPSGAGDAAKNDGEVEEETDVLDDDELPAVSQRRRSVESAINLLLLD